MAAIATIIRAKRLSNVLLSGSVAERKSPDNRMFGRFPDNASFTGCHKWRGFCGFFFSQSRVAKGTSPRGSHRTVLETLASYGSYHPTASLSKIPMHKQSRFSLSIPDYPAYRLSFCFQSFVLPLCPPDQFFI